MQFLNDVGKAGGQGEIAFFGSRKAAALALVSKNTVIF